MARFKKVILSLLTTLLLGGCLGTNRTSNWMNSVGKIKVLSTLAQIGNLVEDIGGERVESLVLIQGELDPHSYEIVKGDAEKLQVADLIFYNGLGLEHGASLSSYLKNSSKTIAVGEKIRDQQPEKILVEEGVIDPHVWMDIALWKEAINPIVEALSEKDPEGALYYQEKGKKLTSQMEEMHAEVANLLQKVPAEKRYLVTSHDAFHYFTRSYLAEPAEPNWQKRFAAPEGLAPDGQLNPKDIQDIIDFIKTTRVSVIFPESNVSKDSIRKIAIAGKELGLNIQICAEPLYGDSMGQLSYLEMMKKNAQTIAEHL